MLEYELVCDERIFVFPPPAQQELRYARRLHANESTPVWATCRFDARGVTSTISDGNTLGTKPIGEDGWLHVTRGKLTASNPKWSQLDFSAGDIRLPKSPGHMRNFIDCVKTRGTCIATAEIGHRSISPGHLGYVSQSVGRPLKWDALSQAILNDPEADQLLRAGSYREPWSLVRKNT